MNPSSSIINFPVEIMSKLFKEVSLAMGWCVSQLSAEKHFLVLADKEHRDLQLAKCRE